MKQTNNVITKQAIVKRISQENVLNKVAAHERIAELSANRRKFSESEKTDNTAAKKHFTEMYDSPSKAAKVLFRYSFKEDTAVQSVCTRELNVGLDVKEYDFVKAILAAISERTKFRSAGKIVEERKVSNDDFRFIFYKEKSSFSPKWINDQLTKSIIKTFEVSPDLVMDTAAAKIELEKLSLQEKAKAEKAEKAAKAKAAKAEKAAKDKK